MTVPRKNAECGLKTSSRYSSLEHRQVNMRTENESNESAEHLGRVSKAHIPGIQKLADDLCFDVGISLARVSASHTMLTHLLSSQTRMLTLELLLLLYNHAPLSRTPLFSSLSPCTLFLCQV